MNELSTFFMVVGFVAAAYSIVANDAIQTLGTFLSSNEKQPWWLLWGFASAVLTLVIVYGWYTHGGDVSYGRLGAKFPVPTEFTWVHVVPPLAIIGLTRLGIPVSTTFLVLTVFAPAALFSMLSKSIAGYVVAFGVGIAVYWLISNWFEKHVSGDQSEDKNSSRKYWIAAQWLSTGFLWSQWLIQDLANIFVYSSTRQLSVQSLLLALVVLLGLHAFIFYRRGGEIQAIVTSKTNTQDIRSATVIDLIYALILLLFKEVSNIPMSTTWVFLGLLAGREVAITLRMSVRSFGETAKIILFDGAKAGAGLAVSAILAIGLPVMDKAINGEKSYFAKLPVKSVASPLLKTDIFAAARAVQTSVIPTVLPEHK